MSGWALRSWPRTFATPITIMRRKRPISSCRRENFDKPTPPGSSRGSAARSSTRRASDTRCDRAIVRCLRSGLCGLAAILARVERIDQSALFRPRLERLRAELRKRAVVFDLMSLRYATGTTQYGDLDRARPRPPCLRRDRRTGYPVRVHLFATCHRRLAGGGRGATSYALDLFP